MLVSFFNGKLRYMSRSTNILPESSFPRIKLGTPPNFCFFPVYSDMDVIFEESTANSSSPNLNIVYFTKTKLSSTPFTYYIYHIIL